MKKIFSASLSFLTIGGAVWLAFIAAILLRTFVAKDSKIVRLISNPLLSTLPSPPSASPLLLTIVAVMVAGIAAVVFLCISFFTFLGITKAFRDDGACGGSGSGSNDPCHKFMGSSKSAFIDYKWGGGMFPHSSLPLPPYVPFHSLSHLLLLSYPLSSCLASPLHLGPGFWVLLSAIILALSACVSAIKAAL